MKKKSAFTLIELLVVVAIIGILATVVVVNMSSAQNKARDAQVRANISAVGKQLTLAANDGTDMTALNCFPSSTTTCDSFSGTAEKDLIAKASKSVNQSNSEGIGVFGNNNSFKAFGRLSSNNNSYVGASNMTTGNIDNFIPVVSNKFTNSNGDYLTIPNIASLQASPNFTIAGWFYATATGSERAVIGKYSGGTNGNSEYLLDLIGTQIRFYSAGTSVGGKTVSLNQWTFFVAGRDDSTGKIFLRTIAGPSDLLPNQVDSIPAPAPIATTNPTQIGSYNNSAGYAFDGKIDSVGFWKRLLTIAEVNALYNGGKGITSSDLTDSIKTNLISWWDLSESSGTRNDAIGTNHMSPAPNKNPAKAPGVGMGL